MDIGWGTPIGDRSDGQDILGVRGLDQGMEASLVVGITTISQRGRYLSILPWALGQFFADDVDSGAVQYDVERLRSFLFRVQYLTLACTAVDPTAGDAGGALGSQIYGTELARLRSGEAISFPFQGQGAMLGTYFGPCRAIGLVRSGDASRPYVITPRGRAIWEARNASMNLSEVRSLLDDADVLTPETARALAPRFSLKSLDPSSVEATLLREAMFSPWSPDTASESERVMDIYGKFTATLDWLREEAGEGLNAEDVLGRNWRRAASANIWLEPVRTAWAEFEWRRRVHFSLELILSAISQSLLETRHATPAELVDSWLREVEFAALVREAWPGAQSSPGTSGRDAVRGVRRDLGLDNGISAAWANLPGAHDRAVAGFVILAALARQSEALRDAGQFENHERTGDEALSVIDDAGDEPFAETLTRLVEVVARAHMTNTFRKMAGGQKCSLRFFPEGARLRTTGDTVGAGRSGPRLWNVIQILRDTGVDGLGARA